MPSISLQAFGKSHEMFSRPFFKISVLLSVAAWLLMIALPAWKVLPDIYGDAVVTMHYNIHFGVDRTGPWWYIFQLPAIGLGFFLLNMGLAMKLWKREPMLSHLFAGVTVAIEAILFVA